MPEIDAIHNQSKVDGEPYHAKGADQERDIAAVSAHRKGRGCGHNALARRCHSGWILS
jgi:hypothetical protein